MGTLRRFAAHCILACAITAIFSIGAAHAQVISNPKLGAYVLALAPPAPMPAMNCAPGTTLFTVMRGVYDDFAQPSKLVDEANLSPYFKAFLDAGYAPYAGNPAFPNLGPTHNRYDQAIVNYVFGDSFQIAIPPGSTVSAARLITRLRPNAGPGYGTNENTIVFHVSGSVPSADLPASPMAGYKLKEISGTGTWVSPVPSPPTPGTPVTFMFDFVPTPTPVSTILPAINASLANPSKPVYLDVYGGGDTGVDFVNLDLCFTPPPNPLPDLAAEKKKTSTGYSLNVTTLASALPTGTVVEVIDYVPLGLTVTGIAASPWSCNPGTASAVEGPEAISCTMTVGAAGIPAGSVLPSIALTTTGSPGCSNCMRVRLKSMPGTTAIEANLANNVSCIL
jgi:hypothetical protein